MNDQPIQYWSIVIPEYKAMVDEFQGYVFLANARVIAPFTSQAEAEDYVKAESIAPYYIVCTENPCYEGSIPE